jgi:hypothetical protein
MTTTEVQAIFDKLDRIDDRLRAIEIRSASTNCADHEGRIRSLERARWIAAGVAAAAGGTLGGVIGKIASLVSGG